MDDPTRSLICSVFWSGLSALALAACATTGAARGGSGTVTNEQLLARNQELDRLIVQALTPCKAKGKPEDRGVIMVTAKADGSVSIGAMQWLGSEEMKQCIAAEAPKARLPGWSGPQVSWIWAVGTKDSPAPKPLENQPPSYRERLAEHVQRTQAQLGGAADASTGPLAACAQRSLPPEAFALVNLRLFIFPDGKVVGVTPTSTDGDGREAGYIDCVMDTVREWTFEPFPGPGFTTVDVPLKYGVNPKEK